MCFWQHICIHAFKHIAHSHNLRNSFKIRKLQRQLLLQESMSMSSEQDMAKFLETEAEAMSEELSVMVRRKSILQNFNEKG